MTTVSSQQSFYKANSLLGLQLLSDVGDQITYALLALSILDISKSTQGVGLIYFIETVGLILFTFVGGMLGDRFSRKKILFCTDIGRALVVLLMIIAFKQQSISFIYATAFLLSVLGALHSPANMSAWAQYVPTPYLKKYNSLSQTVKHGSTIVGPMIAACFIAHDVSSLGFLFDALTFAVCALGFAQVVSHNFAAPTSRESVADGLWKGFSVISRHASLRAYVAYDAIQMISFGAFNATFLVLAQRDFGWSKMEYSYHLSIVAVFTFLGGAFGATNRIANCNDTKKLILCAFISASAYLLMLYTKTFPISSILVGICDGLAIMTISVTRTKGQVIGTTHYPESLSSIMAARRVALSIATLLGTSASIIIGNFVTLETVFKIFVLPLFLSALPVAMKKRNHIRSSQCAFSAQSISAE